MILRSLVLAACCEQHSKNQTGQKFESKTLSAPNNGVNGRILLGSFRITLFCHYHQPNSKGRYRIEMKNNRRASETVGPREIERRHQNTIPSASAPRK